MPRINVDDKDVYGSPDLNQRMNFRERLMKRFAAHEWVRVVNIDDQPFIWQYMPTHGETEHITRDPHRMVYREPVEVYQLDPGEEEVIIGENAYVMIESLYKKVVAKEVILTSRVPSPGQNRNFNWTDPKSQEDIIDRIFLGKETLSFGAKAPEQPKVEDETPDLLSDKPRIKTTKARLRSDS